MKSSSMCAYSFLLVCTVGVLVLYIGLFSMKIIYSSDDKWEWSLDRIEIDLIILHMSRLERNPKWSLDTSSLVGNETTRQITNENEVRSTGRTSKNWKIE